MQFHFTVAIIIIIRRPEVNRNYRYCYFFGGKNVKNIDVRNYAKEHKVNLWEVSERLGYAHETAFSRVLRHELAEDRKIEIKKIIDELAAE